MSLLEIPRPVAIAGEKRVHRLGDDPEDELLEPSRQPDGAEARRVDDEELKELIAQMTSEGVSRYTAQLHWLRKNGIACEQSRLRRVFDDTRKVAAPQQPQRAEESEMPRGVYPRKDKSEKPGVSSAPAKPKAKRAKPKRAKKISAAIASAPTKGANFVVDDSGRIAIVDGRVRIDLSLPDTKRLAIFIDRTKAFRS